MNKIFYFIMTAVASILMFTSCDREALPYEKDNGEKDPTALGELNLSSMKIGVKTDELNNSSTRATVDVSAYIIEIYEEGEEEAVKSFSYNEMPDIISLLVGTYTVEVNSHVPEAAAWEKPHYFASQSFDIRKNETTDLGTITCRLKNIKTTIEFTDELKALLGSDVNVKVVANGDGELNFAKDEARAGFFKALNDDANVLNATLSGTVDGQSINLVNNFSGIKAGEYRKIKYSLKSNPGDPDGGNMGMVIEIDAECEIVDITISIDPDVDPVVPGENAPTIVGTSFGGNPFSLDESHVVSGKTEVKVTLNAPNKINNVEVTIDSNTLTEDILTEVGLSKSFDLANPGALEAGLQGLGFPTGSDVVGQTTLLFDITEFTPLLGIYGAGTHNFVIKVTDKAGESVTKTLTLITESTESGENAPTIVGTSFAGNAFNIDESHVVSGKTEVKVTLNAPNKINNVEVTIDSNTLTEDILTEVGLSKSFDLANPGALETGLQGLGFPTGSDVVGETQLLFDITEFTELLGIYGAATHNFIIKVTDQDGVSVTKTLTLITE